MTFNVEHIVFFLICSTDDVGKVDPSSISDLLTEPGWKEKLQDEFTAPYFRTLETSLLDEFKKNEVFPPRELIFNAFHITPFDKVSYKSYF